jgi:hypothetical protein
VIRELRRGHRIVWLALALLLPALLVAALLARRAPPPQELPPTLAPDAAMSDDVGAGTAAR